jgi:hypothetical protein
MFKQPISPFTPYTIPRTPNIGADSKTNYFLSAKAGASSEENPSRFLEWKEQPILPTGEDNDMLKWSGEEWVAFSPSGSSEEPHYLNYDGEELSWSPVKSSFEKGKNKGDILYWDPEAGEDEEGDWVVLQAPANSSIAIQEFLICEDGEAATKHMLVWETT